MRSLLGLATYLGSGLVLAGLFSGCITTMPCPDGQVAAPDGTCIPADGGSVDAGRDAPSADVDLTMRDTPGGGDGCVPSRFYADRDSDDHGDATTTTMACSAPTGYVSSDDDCDDDDAMRHPGLSETCDGIDNDCDDTVDDGVLTTYYVDADGDDHGAAGMTMMACTRPAGYAAAGDDCDDTASVRFPGNPEICDAFDNDCDAPMVDEDFACARGAPVACTTTCGSMGLGNCSATCTAPVTCAPPAESCGAVARDDDCDGQVDEGVQSLGPRRDLTSSGGGTSGRVVVVPTISGYVVVFATSGGIFAQRFDLAGAVVGTAVRATTTPTDSFDAYSTGSRLVVTWIGGSNLSAMVFNEDLTILTSARDITPADSFTTRVSVVATPAGVLFVFHDGNISAVRAVSRSYPGLTGAGAVFTVASSARPDLETTIDASRVYVAYVTSAGQVQVTSALLSGSAEGMTASFPSANPQRTPVLDFTTTPAGARRLAVAWHENPAGTASDLLRFSLLDVAAGGALTIRDTVTIYAGPAPDTVPDPMQVTFGGGRWFVPYLRLGSPATSSSWQLAEIEEPAAGAPTVLSYPVEGTNSANRSVGIVAARGLTASGPSALLAASRTDGVGRAYLWGCP